MDSQKANGFLDFIKTHSGILIGSSAGLIVGVLIITIGFFSTLFLAICTGIGAFFGSKNKYKKRLIEALDKILPDLFR